MKCIHSSAAIQDKKKAKKATFLGGSVKRHSSCVLDLQDL